MTEKKKSGFEALAKSSLYPQEEMLKVKKAKHSFFIGLPREISLQENRISLTPDAVAILATIAMKSDCERKATLSKSSFKSETKSAQVLAWQFIDFSGLNSISVKPL